MHIVYITFMLVQPLLKSLTHTFKGEGKTAEAGLRKFVFILEEDIAVSGPKISPFKQLF